MTTQALTVGSGAPTIAGVPVGASCTVSETAPANLPADSHWGAPLPVQTIASVVAVGNSVSFVNPLIATARPPTQVPVPLFGNWLHVLFAPALVGICFLRLPRCL
ncbi:MAG: hypothetical protein J0I77_04295 [Rudaea sp.]|uniref:DUF5979 domain-containing protein n=1 Tax=unclassified Rudaea TaxID=2627037 RepID=UPI0010F9B1DA|nr:MULTISPECIES: DUF5979 domain-containing protein [unclassified Rudaea]MBN8884913.1 hypothetical protein [Rudaea sp.]MBR0346330.1 hypothetical protein [Rudaea sp.]